MDKAVMTRHYDSPFLSREGGIFAHASLLLLAYLIHYTISLLPFFSI